MHTIEYKNAYSDWQEALPLGNGHFGAMGYLDSHDGLTFIFNHYDVYYKVLGAYSRHARVTNPPKEPWSKASRAELEERAQTAHANPDHPGHQNYNVAFNPAMTQSYGVRREGFSNAIAGQLRFEVDSDSLATGPFITRLDIERARVEFSAKDVQIRSVVLRNTDVFAARVSGAVEAVEIAIPPCRMLAVSSATGANENVGCFHIENLFYPQGEDQAKYGPFRYVWMVKVGGAKARIKSSDSTDRLVIEIEKPAGDYVLLATVVSEEETTDVLTTAARKLDHAEDHLDDLEQSHRDYWRSFFDRSGVHLPDPMLETLWYLHLYSLACGSGDGANIYQEACGLSGLWNIKVPSQWGSMWYWDVNIQQSFWPVFTANHLELAGPFHRALLSHVEKARQWARRFHGLDGIAADYPFDLFLCIWPWCAQYFWWYYAYSGDMEFLRETAYPLFKDILRFVEQYLKEDPTTGQVYIFPDVSPEQGPMTRNSTISLSTWKYLLQCAIKAGTILKEDAEDQNRWEILFRKFPDYPTGDHDRFGTVIKDSEWASPDLYLAHSSLLMPIYPIGDLSGRSDPAKQSLLRNTLRYADNSQTIGTHNLWPAPAAARLGLGDEAVRMLYHRGIGFMMRSNGLFAEETERWIQNCLTACVPVYNPPLIEAGSTVVAAINEMLLWSFDGTIEVFPAIPMGMDLGKTTSSRYDKLSDTSRRTIPVWRDCSFENLRAEGAFEVSAWRKDGKTVRVTIKSLKGNDLRLMNPFPSSPTITCDDRPIAFTCNEGLVHFPTKFGGTYELAISQELASHASLTTQSPLVFTAFTGRRVFLGKDEHTDFYRALDAATLDYYAGDTPVSPISVYKLDFTAEGLEKSYASVLAKQYHACGKQGLDFMRITTKTVFSPVSGIGWSEPAGLVYHDRIDPDSLRRDFIGSADPHTFQIELPNGSYQILIVAGDAQEPTWMKVEMAGRTAWDSGLLRPGGFGTCVFYFHRDRDGLLDLTFHTAPGRQWKVNLLILNRIV